MFGLGLGWNLPFFAGSFFSGSGVGFELEPALFYVSVDIVYPTYWEE